MSNWHIGIIGGSGLYEVEGVEGGEWVNVASPWGEPSDAIFTGRLGHVRVSFLPRHGRGHRISPSELNARANIDCLKRLGVTDILSVSSVGGLQEERAPGTFTIVDQFIDRTKGRPSSFFGTGMVAHVSMADPICPRLSALAADAAEAAGASVHRGGTCLVMEGPQFSTRAESHLYRSWGCDVIGMTAMPEAKLAREAELPFAMVAMVTDYDCWREEEAAVDVAQVIAQLGANATKARAMVLNLLRDLPAERTASPIDTCLDTALITAPSVRDPELLAKLDAVAGRVLG
ncbi:MULTISPECIES: S-methyl-5'-thioadenosine phosphorylase [unclassified Sphingomonas]|uniref:S-methyl-5'-thioadenosine phosphorylase n=1 Tax=unclassified Sphingomonas TaxID=196159 RepID=UPI0021519B9F|nr:MULTISPECIES: S-methyl-5'-thioadenosine phosphorylase [unclassified Sphingomonas]MCR5870108.1 S-methyl-5'-thioadenosine phosphorylase [Sphingomonas sp. J344]UUX98200.1 S-methyl-5'-thioadenosine phosphorylase [Sphingomonas sp. J315]